MLDPMKCCLLVAARCKGYIVPLQRCNFGELLRGSSKASQIVEKPMMSEVKDRIDG